MNENSFKNKKLLVLGGTLISCEIIKKAHEMGLFVGVADYNDIDRSPGKQIADEAHLTDVSDIDAVVELVRTRGYDGVLCGFADVILPFYAEICEKSGLPCYGTKEQFELFIDKEKYKRLLRNYDIPTVKEYELDLNDYSHSIEQLEYPVMIKPADSSGARGITVCNRQEEVEEALIKARSFSRQDKIIAEQYLTGKEATVFWTFKDGKRYLSCIGNRHVKNNQEGVIPLPVGYTFPAKVTQSYISDIEPKMQKMFEDLDIRNGMMFLQCKVENGVCVVYDIGFRLTGSLEYEIIRKVCGYDPLEMLIHFAITGSMGVDDLENRVDPYFNGEYGYNVSVLSRPGKIARIEGYDRLSDKQGVINTVLAHLPGEEITQSMKGLLSQITVRVLGYAKDMDELKNRMFQVYDSISVISDNGEELKLLGMEDEDFEGVI